MTKISENVLAVPRSLRIPRLFDACANSVYQALLFSSPCEACRAPPCARKKRDWGQGYVMSWCALSCHGVHSRVMVCTVMSWCAQSCHGVHCHVMVCTVVSWCALSCHSAHSKPLNMFGHTYKSITYIHNC